MSIEGQVIKQLMQQINTQLLNQIDQDNIPTEPRWLWDDGSYVLWDDGSYVLLDS